MKKSILTILFIAMTMTMFATSPIKFGVIAGFNSNKTDNEDVNSGGSTFGVLTEIPVLNNLYICPGIQVTQKTSALSYKTYRNTYELNGEKAVIRYLEIPLNVKFKFNTNTSVPLFIAAGPTFSYGLKGIVKNDKWESVNVYTNDTAFDLNRFDFGFGGSVGAELFKHVQISLGYNMGTASVSKLDCNLKSKNRTSTLSVAYVF